MDRNDKSKKENQQMMKKKQQHKIKNKDDRDEKGVKNDGDKV